MGSKQDNLEDREQMIILGSNGMLGGMVRAHFRKMPSAHPWDIPSYILRIEPNSRAKIHEQLDVFNGIPFRKTRFSSLEPWLI